jgi:DNA sulfur modification protein DndD
MIFQQLTLRNFGQYKGSHNISLNINNTKPILLIGGHNGGGKTTILEAMQLCLYGKRANCYRRADLRWNDYLRAWINRDSDPNDEIQIKLSFQHPYEGKDSNFEVDFSWRSTGTSIREQKDIFINNILDQTITATWDKFIDSILPARLSNLFFFDGEKIENLVRPETAQQFLESAITDLLGIGTIEQLQRDLAALNRNRLLRNEAQIETKKLNDAQDEYESVKKHLHSTEEQLGMLRKQMKDEEKQIEIHDSEYKSKGGKLLDEQASNEALKKELEQQLETLNKQIIREESGILPLSLVKDQLKEIKRQFQEEKEIDDCIHQKQQLDLIHCKYLKIAEQYGASEKVLNAMSQFAGKENERIEKMFKDTITYLNLPANATPLLDTTLKVLPRTEAQYKQLKKQRMQLQNRLEQIKAKLDATPEKGDLKSIFEQRRNCFKKLSAIEIQLKTKEELLEQLRNRSSQLKNRVVRLLEETAQETAKYEDDQRTVLYSLKAQAYIKEFREQLLNRHINKLEAYILDSFKRLIKKQSLIHDLKIDTSSFAIILTNKEGKIIPAEKLSAGERQLLAIAIFWGLQKASNRSIPVIIDTPMGRLDSTHRKYLVNRYLPFAAHQVILLSTDEEIIGEYYTQISKHVSNEWMITYDEENKSTLIKEGYFQ